MARKTAMHVSKKDDRDQGKIYFITEMPSAQAEKWAARMILALLGSNIDIPENFQSLGMAGLAELGVRAIGSLKWEIAEPLLDEMMDCVKIQPDPTRPEVQRFLFPGDIEEVSTRFDLRIEWWKLHMDFLKSVANSLPSKGTPADGK